MKMAISITIAGYYGDFFRRNEREVVSKLRNRCDFVRDT